MIGPMADPKQILAAARTILLVDWPNPSVPRSLLESGFAVFGFSPAGYSAAELVADLPNDVGAGCIFPPRSENETGFLVFRKLANPPSQVDIVNVYRPAGEIPGIVATHVAPLGARALWLQPPGTSDEARCLSSERGIAFVDAVDIADVAREMRLTRT